MLWSELRAEAQHSQCVSHADTHMHRICTTHAASTPHTCSTHVHICVETRAKPQVSSRRSCLLFLDKHPSSSLETYQVGDAG